LIHPTHHSTHSRRRQAWFIDLVAVLIVLRVVLACAAALGQQPAWYTQGCYVDENGNMVCNSRMPRPRLPVNWQPPPQPPSIYSQSPLPPPDPPSPPVSPPPAAAQPATAAPPAAAAASPTAAAPAAKTGAEQVAADAVGWEPAGPQPQSQTTIIYAAFDNHDLARAIINVDRSAAERDAELRKSLDERTATFSGAIDGLPGVVKGMVKLAMDSQSVALEKLPAALQSAAHAGVSEGFRGMAVKMALERPSTFSFIAQVVLIALGSTTIIGGMYGGWRLAAWAGGKLLGYAIAKQLSNHAAPTLGSTPAASAAPRPPLQRYEFDRERQAAVAVDTPPIVHERPGESHYVPYETANYAHCSQWADEQLARKFGNRPASAVELLNARASLLKQCLAGQRS
jgi:hypothetical protein